MTSAEHRARPSGSNADEWAMFLAEHEGSIPYVAVQIAESIDAARSKQELFDVGGGLAVSFNPHGRFHGWLFRQQDGQYVSARKLDKLEGTYCF